MYVVTLWVVSSSHQFVFVTKPDAGWIGYARTHIEHMHLFGRPIIYIMTYLWPRANKTHIAKQHIDQLRKFIELVLTYVVSRTRHTWVASADGNQRTFVRTHTH